MAKVAFRFDIDSHKCIRDGVPILIELSNMYDVPFTFYVNMGRAISIRDTLLNMVKKENRPYMDIKKLSALQKLGMKEYLYAAIINPKMIKYKENIQLIMNSKCELGIHGGMNHSHWYMYADGWSYKKCKKELQNALHCIKNIIPDYEPLGFAAPGFVTSTNVERALKDIGFRYSCNWYKNGEKNIINIIEDYVDVAVNLCGEPGGVAFWEYAAASNWTDEYTFNKFMEIVKSYSYVVVFDHPYFVALQKKELLAKIIKALKEEGNDIVTVSDIALGGI